MIVARSSVCRLLVSRLLTRVGCEVVIHADGITLNGRLDSSGCIGSAAQLTKKRVPKTRIKDVVSAFTGSPASSCSPTPFPICKEPHWQKLQENQVAIGATAGV